MWPDAMPLEEIWSRLFMALIWSMGCVLFHAVSIATCLQASNEVSDDWWMRLPPHYTLPPDKSTVSKVKLVRPELRHGETSASGWSLPLFLHPQHISLPFRIISISYHRVGYFGIKIFAIWVEACSCSKMMFSIAHWHYQMRIWLTQVYLN